MITSLFLLGSLLLSSTMVGALEGAVSNGNAVIQLPAVAEMTFKLPEPSEGNVDGKEGMLFWPVASRDNLDSLLDPTGCLVHLFQERER
jgi:hypothetical protein